MNIGTISLSGTPSYVYMLLVPIFFEQNVQIPHSIQDRRQQKNIQINAFKIFLRFASKDVRFGFHFQRRKKKN